MQRRRWCRGCHRPVRLVQTAGGATLTLDPWPDRVRGDVLLGDDGLGRELPKDAAVLARGRGQDLYLAHGRTCVYGEQYTRLAAR